MQTIQDIQNLCESRGLDLRCILNYTAKAKQHEAFTAMTEQDKLDWFYAVIDATSGNPNMIADLRARFEIGAGWAIGDSHAIGKYMASIVETNSVFGLFVASL